VTCSQHAFRSATFCPCTIVIDPSLCRVGVTCCTDASLHPMTQNARLSLNFDVALNISAPESQDWFVWTPQMQNRPWLGKSSSFRVAHIAPNDRDNMFAAKLPPCSPELEFSVLTPPSHCLPLIYLDRAKAKHFCSPE
jgi:hypothetical protein